MRYLAVLVWMWFCCMGLAKAAPEPEDFGQLPAIYDAAISPDGTRVAIFQNIKGNYGIRVVDLSDPSGTSGGIMLGEAKPKWIKWANDNQVLASVWRANLLLRAEKFMLHQIAGHNAQIFGRAAC